MCEDMRAILNSAHHAYTHHNNDFDSAGDQMSPVLDTCGIVKTNKSCAPLIILMWLILD